MATKRNTRNGKDRTREGETGRGMKGKERNGTET